VSTSGGRAAKARFRVGDWGAPARMELRGNEYLAARYTAVAEDPADAFLIAVCLSASRRLWLRSCPPASGGAAGWGYPRC